MLQLQTLKLLSAEASESQYLKEHDVIRAIEKSKELCYGSIVRQLTELS
jgi:hypothetical protein